MRDLKTQSANSSIAQQKLLAIVPKISSFFSLVGSLYIIYDVSRLPKAKRRMYHRILLGMSISDVFASAAWFCSTWPADPDVLPIWGASGTQQTCTLQGFFAQTPLTSVFYSGWLAVYYFLVIRCGWTHHHLARSKIEWVVHSSSIIFGVSTATASASLGILNPLGFTCWIAGVPLGCKESWLNNGETNCVRGDNAKLYQWAFWYIPLWLVIVTVTGIMGSIVWRFYNQERQNEIHRRRAVGKKNSDVLKSWSHSKLRDIVWQSLYYVGSFYISWTFPTILRITQVSHGTVWYHWELLTAAFVPSQGIWNIMIYLRPQYLKMRQNRLKSIQKRLHSGTVSTYSETDLRKNPKVQPIIDSEIEQEVVVHEGTCLRESFSSPSSKPPTIESVDPKRLEGPERPSITKQASRGGGLGFIREMFQDMKDVLMKGDEGLDHSYFDDSVVPPSSENDGAVSGDDEQNEENEAIEVIETDGLGLPTDPEEKEDMGKQEMGISNATILEQWHAQESEKPASEVSQFEQEHDGCQQADQL